ncbi:MAG: hypothetical protein ACHQQS_13560 [Thermoanaerobaculales bacterium]
MAGPVWKYDEGAKGVCDFCLRAVEGMFLEGEIADDSLVPIRRVCRDCFERSTKLVVRGEVGGHAVAPAYAHNAEPPR